MDHTVVPGRSSVPGEVVGGEMAVHLLSELDWDWVLVIAEVCGRGLRKVVVAPLTSASVSIDT